MPFNIKKAAQPYLILAVHFSVELMLSLSILVAKLSRNFLKTNSHPFLEVILGLDPSDWEAGVAGGV